MSLLKEKYSPLLYRAKKLSLLLLNYSPACWHGESSALNLLESILPCVTETKQNIQINHFKNCPRTTYYVASPIFSLCLVHMTICAPSHLNTTGYASQITALKEEFTLQPSNSKRFSTFSLAWADLFLNSKSIFRRFWHNLFHQLPTSLLFDLNWVNIWKM